MSKHYFKVGDIITAKFTDEYFYGGCTRNGEKARVLELMGYNSPFGSAIIKVEWLEGGIYAMLESEFKEYNQKISSNKPSNLLERLPENWYTEKTDKICDLMLKLFSDEYSIDEIEDYRNDSDYMFIGSDDSNESVNINKKEYFSDVQTYYTNDYILSLFPELTGELKTSDSIKEVCEEIRKSDWNGTSSPTKNDLNQITKETTVIKSFFNF